MESTFDVFDSSHIDVQYKVKSIQNGKVSLEETNKSYDPTTGEKKNTVKVITVGEFEL